MCWFIYFFHLRPLISIWYALISSGRREVICFWRKKKKRVLKFLWVGLTERLECDDVCYDRGCLAQSPSELRGYILQYSLNAHSCKPRPYGSSHRVEQFDYCFCGNQCLREVYYSASRVRSFDKKSNGGGHFYRSTCIWHEPLRQNKWCVCHGT